MDQGLAKDLQETVLTRTGAYVGTPRFLAPEVAEGAQVFRVLHYQDGEGREICNLWDALKADTDPRENLASDGITLIMHQSFSMEVLETRQGAKNLHFFWPKLSAPPRRMCMSLYLTNLRPTAKLVLEAAGEPGFQLEFWNLSSNQASTKRYTGWISLTFPSSLCPDPDTRIRLSYQPLVREWGGWMTLKKLVLREAGG
jgi:serine/threonine protein kinase